MSVNEIEEVKGPSRQGALDAWAKMQQMHAERRTKNNSENTALNDRSNANDKIQDSLDGAVRNEATGNIQTPTQVSAADNANNSGNQNSSNFSGNGQKDANLISNVLLQKDRMEAKQVSFNFGSEDDLRLRQAQTMLAKNLESRFGVKVGDELQKVIRGMDEDTLREASKMLSLQRRPSADAPEAVREFFVRVDNQMQRVTMGE